MAENPILNNRYRLIEQIGSGGMAVVYKAQDMDLGRTVAVKVLRPSLVSDPELTERFRREARSAANLSHPNIVTVHDVGQDGDKTHYIVTEYVPGQNLKQILRARGAFDVDAALAVIVEVCKGVGYAHRAGLVHCDMKPQNILVTPERRIKVVDFGIARAFSPDDAGAERVDTVWGSPSYFSPEQAAGEPPGPPSDVYSIGIVLFELLTGRLPFMGNKYEELALAHLNQAPPSVHDYNPAIPDELAGIVEQTLSKEPANRYRTADQLGRILQKYHEQGMQQTSSFQVTQSNPKVDFPETPTPPPALPPRQGPQRPAAPQQPEPEPPVYDPTVPTLPPISRSRARGTPPPPGGRPPVAVYAEEPPRHRLSPEHAEGDLPRVDFTGIALAVFAGALVVGLIPLWVTVILTLTR